jgi:general secretion pathway protein D
MAAGTLFALSCVAITWSPLEAFAQKDEFAKDESTEINVKNADIAAVVRIFSKKTRRNYILDDRVKGKISIYLPGKVSSEESINILDAVLALKGFTTVPIGNNLWKIVPAKEAIQSTIPTLTEQQKKNPSAAMVTRLLPLKFVGADDAKQLLTPLVSGNGLINAYTGTNSLIIIDSADNVKRLVHLVESIDVPFSNREMSIIPIENADAVEIAETLGEILGDDSEEKSSSSGSDSVRARLREQSGSKSSSGRTPTAALALANASGETISARGRAPKIIADERTNSIIVVADDESTARIRALISQLDSEVDLSGIRYYVYRCQHASAEELAEVLSGLGDGGGSSNSSRGSDIQLRSDRNNNSLERGNRFRRTQERLQNQQRTPGRSRGEGREDGGGVSNVSIGDNVSITADPSTNSLIIHAGKTDYQKIMELLSQLDIKRKQVLVEAMLLEVGLDDSLVTEFEFLTSAGGKDGGVVAKSTFSDNLATLISDPVQLTNFSVAAASSGTLTLPGNITVPTQTRLTTKMPRLSLDKTYLFSPAPQPAEIT